MGPVWFCEQDMVDRQVGSGFPNFADAVDMAGMEAVRTGYADIGPAMAAVYTQSIVGGWGTVGFLRRIRENFADCRAVFDQAEARDYDVYAPHLRHLMINGSYEKMPLRDAMSHRRIDREGGIFVKPAAEAKTFTGLVIDGLRRAAAMEKLKDVRPDLPCIVAPAVAGIESEYRFVIVDGEVVTGSQYQRGGVKDVRSDVMPQAAILAHIVATMEWQAASVYVCDVAVMDTGLAYVVELNPFSSCGLYACDTLAIANAVKAHFHGPDTAPDNQPPAR